MGDEFGDMEFGEELGEYDDDIDPEDYDSDGNLKEMFSLDEILEDEENEGMEEEEEEGSGEGELDEVFGEKCEKGIFEKG